MICSAGLHEFTFVDVFVGFAGWARRYGGWGQAGRQSAGAAGALAGPLDGGARGAGGLLSFCDRLHGRSVPCGSALLPLWWAGLAGRARKEPPCPYCHPVGALLAWPRLIPAPQPACAGLSSDGGRWARVADLRGCRQGRVGNLFGWCRKGGGFEGVDARGLPPRGPIYKP